MVGGGEKPFRLAELAAFTGATFGLEGGLIGTALTFLMVAGLLLG
jgi:hypothetical protein